jgi:CubicO group peptidase (beta-lactamase class C family)
MAYGIGDSALLALDGRIRSVRIDACLVWQRGSLVYSYFRNPQEERELHKVNSVTKSVLSVLVGIALGRRDLGTLDASVAEYFPEAPPDKRPVTLKHLLGMTPGFEWQEAGAWGSLPPPSEQNPNWIRFILERKMVEPPGKRMVYNSGCSHLLSAILQKATGMTASEYAGRYLFAPLGIDCWRWPSDAEGISIGGFGLLLRPADLLKLGRLMLEDGRWEGNQVVPAAWIRESTLPRLPASGRDGWYGYHWWIYGKSSEGPASPRVYYAQGFAGQFLIVVPEAQLAVVFTGDLGKKTLTPLHIFADTLFNDMKQSGAIGEK